MTLNRFFLESGRDSRNTYTSRQAPTVEGVASIVLGTDAKSVTVPACAVVAVISATSNFYCNARGTAVIPTTTDFAFTDSTELNPTGYDVKELNGSDLSFISEEPNNVVTVTFYN